MTFKVITNDLFASELAEKEFAKAFFYSERHLALVGRVYGALIAAVDDLAVPMKRIIEDELHALRREFAYSYLSPRDRECVDWVLERAVIGEPPKRAKPEMAAPEPVVSVAETAVIGLVMAIAANAPAWKRPLIEAMWRFLDSDRDYRRLGRDEQGAVAEFIHEADELAFAPETLPKSG